MELTDCPKNLPVDNIGRRQGLTPVINNERLRESICPPI
jgi:hypothetical protein